MEFKEGLKIARKMCTRDCDYCVGCAFKDDCQFGILPYKWSAVDIEKISELVEKWAEKHKPKTWLEVLREKLPNANHDKIAKCFCPVDLFELDAVGPHDADCGEDCNECWNSIAPERYQNHE